ncbi:hypothetical protein EV175_002426 [Coemansia sp. RSA 1933]|nr:hypothetical protein EV175_002426 [Coemansia sp. RSA 1933]
MADIIPDPEKFDENVSSSRLHITPVELRKLANKFIETNRGNALDLAARMEAWRRDVLVAFGGDFSEVTLAASLFGKTSRNKALACALFKVAAEEGYQNAAYNYALLIGTKEMKVDGGNVLSKKIIQELTQLNHVPSMLVMSDIKLRDKNVNDVKEAVTILKRAAKLKSGHAHFRLGYIYSSGLLGKPDYKRAIEYFGKLNEFNSPDGYYVIGCMLAQGKGTFDGKPDMKAVIENFEKAAAMGSSVSQYELGLRYVDGIDVAKDMDLGVEYLKLAAEGKMVLAMLKLCSLYILGTDVSKDYKEARRYLNDAAKYAGSNDNLVDRVRQMRAKLDELDKKSWCTIM